MTITIPWALIVACIGALASIWAGNPFSGLMFSVAGILAADDRKLFEEEDPE